MITLRQRARRRRLAAQALAKVARAAMATEPTNDDPIHYTALSFRAIIDNY